MGKKLFGSSTGSKFSGNASSERKSRALQPDTASTKKEQKVKKSRPRLRTLKVILTILLVLEILYCLAIFTDLPVISDLRTMYIKTAMSTMRHQWLATAFIPGDIVDEVVRLTEDARDEQIGMNSSWDDVTTPTIAPSTSEGETPEVAPTVPPETAPPQGTTLTPEQDYFFGLFHELDQQSTLAYVEANPDAIVNGWDRLYINEAGLDDKGTTIKTIHGDSVLAIDAENGVLLIRVTGSTFRGVLAIAKDPTRLTLELAAKFGTSGQQAGKIATKHNGILAMTASGFQDEGGVGNGGIATGVCVSHGEEYGDHFKWGYKRIELRKDHRMYIVDAPTKTHKDTLHAAEFWPALVVNGENALGRNNQFTELNPRACLGQTKKGEVLMMVIEGRSITSLGATAEDCVEILLRYGCYQGMNMDGGTSAIMWFDGEYVTKCSNSDLKAGRLLPNAWVYKKISE